MTPAHVASKSIDAVPKSRADNSPCSTFINIYAGSPIRPQLQAWRRTATAHFPFQHITAILTVCHGARKGTGACSVWQKHVAIQTVALVAAVRVHASVFAWPGLQSTLVQILVARFSSISWVALALVWPNAFTVFASWLAYRLALSPGHTGPSPAAVNSTSKPAQSC